MKNGRIVIVGNGGAAVSAAQAARISGYSGEIHIISDVNAPAFNPMLSPYYLKGDITWDRCFPYGNNFYREYDITCHFAARVVSLDAVNQQVVTIGGKTFSYDRCLIATGAGPVIPPIPGLKDSSRAFPLRTAASVADMENAIGFAKRVAVLGASLVGLKVAEVLCKKKINVVLLDVVEQVLPNGAHPSSAGFLKEYFQEHGADVRLGCTMEGMEGTSEHAACRFSDYSIEEVDFVAVCTGVRPNIDFIDTHQVEIGQAVLTDERMQTTARNLYAAGDASQGLNLFTGKYEWMGTWGSACRQGRVAGCNMAGEDAYYPGSIRENISPFFDWTYAQIGDVQPQGKEAQCIITGDPRKRGHCVLAFDQDILVGVNLINCTHLAGKLRRAIFQKWRWGDYLDDLDKNISEDRLEIILNKMTDSFCRYPI